MITVEKKIIGNLSKCYSIAPLTYKGSPHLLVAAEKQDPCLLFDLDGNLVDTVWTEPGGVMTMVQIPGSDGSFLATHKFYSPNDSKEAKIVLVTPVSQGNWQVKTLVDLPHVHRFDILERNGVRYLIACALKSGHEFKDDWSMPGKVYAGVLPDDLSGYDENNQLELKVIKDNMLKNHGYYRVTRDGVPGSLISCDSGVYRFTPPETAQGEWKIETLLEEAASDGVLVDLDGDGEEELVVLSPFHGEHIYLYKKTEGSYRRIYEYPEPAEFTHSIFGGLLCGKPAVVIGHRQGKRNLLAFTYDQETKGYQVQVLDQDCGSANIYKFQKDGIDRIISTNREIDEIAIYTLREE